MYMDADDTMHPQRTEIILTEFEKNNPIAITHEFVNNISDLPKTIDTWKTVKGKEMFKIEMENAPRNQLNVGIPIHKMHHGHLSVQRKVFDDGLKFSKRSRGEDAEFVRNIIKHYGHLGDKNLNYIRTPLSVYVKRDNIKGSGNVKNILENSYIITLNTTDLDFDKVNLIDRRITELEESFQFYELPYRIFYGLYYDGTDHTRSKESIEEIKENYPFIKINKLENNGEIGLLGSFFKLLESTEETIDNYLTIYEDDAKPIGPKIDFWRKFNNALGNLPHKDDHNYPGVYMLSYMNYCRHSCPNTDKWYKGHKKNTGGAHALIIKRAALVKILKYCKKNGVDLPVDKLIVHLNDKGVIHMYTWEGESSNGGMFCGLFSQSETYCDKRNSLIDHYHLRK
jgi:hypothetical protein